MQVQSVGNINFTGSIYGDLKKGKKAFESLSPVKQICATSFEHFRKENNYRYHTYIPPKDRDLSGYICYRDMIAKSLEKVLAKYKTHR